MRTRLFLALVAGWLLGLATFWTSAMLTGGWYEYEVMGPPVCEPRTGFVRRMQLGATHIAPNQPDPCHVRTPRFRLP